MELTTGATCPTCQLEREIPSYMNLSQMVCPFDNAPMEAVKTECQITNGLAVEDFTKGPNGTRFSSPVTNGHALAEAAELGYRAVFGINAENLPGYAPIAISFRVKGYNQ